MKKLLALLFLLSAGLGAYQGPLAAPGACFNCLYQNQAGTYDAGTHTLSGTAGTFGNSVAGGTLLILGTLTEQLPAMTTGNWTGVDGTVVVYNTNPNTIEKVADGVAGVTANTGTPVIGALYKMVLNITITSGTTIAHFGGINFYQSGSVNIGTTGTITQYFLATATSTLMQFQSGTTTRWKINSISCSRVTLGAAQLEGATQVNGPLCDADGNTLLSFAQPGQVLLGQDGTALNPAIAFKSATSMGMYRAAANKLDLGLANQAGILIDGAAGGPARLGYGSSTGTCLAAFHILSDSNSTVQGVAWGSTGPLYIYKSATDTLSTTGGFLSLTATTGIGYGTGAGGIVTQSTNKTTGVTRNTVTGQITMNNALLAAATTVSFTFTNSRIAATDVIIVNVASGGTAGAYQVTVGAVAAGSCEIDVRNVSAGGLSEALVLNYAVIKGVSQ